MVCEKCAASTSASLAVGRKGNLPLACTGAIAEGSQGRLRRLLSGRLPWQESAWPDGRREGTEVAFPYPLELNDEEVWQIATEGANQ